MIDVRVKRDPRLSRGEQMFAQQLIDHIQELENRENHHWTEMARLALLVEVQNQIIGKQAATKITSFLNRHRIKGAWTAGRDQ